MRRYIITAILLSISCAAAVHAQASDQALNDFRAQVLKQPLIPRGFSDDPVTTFQWNGTDLSFAEPKLHTLGVMKPDSVEIKANKLKITGKRQTLLRDKDGTLKLAGGSPATLIVDLSGSAPMWDLQALRVALFFPTPKDALAALPLEYASLASAAPSQMKLCPMESQKIQRPKVLSVADVEYSTEARQAHANGFVEVLITVSAKGLPSNIWIVRPFGLGMDEKSAEAVAKYKFHPATCDGQPTAVALFIDMAFAM